MPKEKHLQNKNKILQQRLKRRDTKIKGNNYFNNLIF